MLTEEQVAAALSYIRSNREIWEVVLTGGDPLILGHRRLKHAVGTLDKIEHVKVVRIHTRVPVVAPSLVTAALLSALKARSMATYVVVHANHPRELTLDARAACAAIVDAGIPMLSQSVLLRGVNDDPEILGELMRVLVETRIKPYYLHHGDLAPGTGHFRTSIAKGQELIRCLRGRYSGLCQPTYVLDIPGGHGKAPIGPTYLERAEPRSCQPKYLVEGFDGHRHPYPPAPT